jgi:hypothetical protein
MSTKPPLFKPTLPSQVEKLSKMASEQTRATSALVRSPLAPNAAYVDRQREVAARTLAAQNTSKLAATFARQASEAVKRQGIVNPLATRRNVGPIGGKTRRNKTSGGDIVSHLLTIRNQIKLYHWQTSQFARHKATDDLTAALDLNIDAFVESYMGRYGRPMVKGSIKLHNFSESAAKTFVARESKYLEKELPKKIGKGDTDLLNLRDTILGDLTKASYLFTLQ